MNTETETLINVLRSRMENMTGTEREDLISQLQEGYCSHCMGEHLPCYCWNDE